MSNTRVRAVFLVVVVAVLVAPVIGAELYLRHLGLGDPILYYTNSTYRYAPLPNQRKQRLNEAWVTIDGRGLRTPEPWDDPADVRILFIGNSVTWSGTSIDDKATFPYLTCLELERRTGRSFTCGNAGVNAYGTDNMAARLRYTPIRNEQAIVVTLIYPDMLRGLTDLRSQHFFSSKPNGPLPALYEVATILLVQFTDWLRFQSGVHYEDEDKAVAEESLRRLLDVLKEKEREGKAVLVVLSPLRSELGGKENPLTRLAERLVQEYQLPSINMNALLSRESSDSTFTDLKHLGSLGHRIYGTTIADSLSGRLRQHQAH